MIIDTTVASRDFDLFRNILFYEPVINTCGILMAYFSISEEEANALYYSPKFIQGQPLIRWNDQQGKKQQITINLTTEGGTPFRIRGWCYHDGEIYHYAFSLLFKNIVIRRWDASIPHPNPKENGKKVELNEPHKHFHHPSYRDKKAYVTKDIRLNDANGALIDFLKECNVNLDCLKFQPTLGLI